MRNLLTIMLFGVLLSLSACGKKEERILPKVTPSAEQAVTGDQSGIEREAFINQAQKEIDEMVVNVAILRKKALDATGNAKKSLEQQIVTLEQKQKNVEERLANLKSAIGEGWKDLKSGVTDSIEKFKQAVKHSN